MGNKKERKLNKEFIQNEIMDLISWNHYDYYDPSEIDNPTQRDLLIFGLPIYKLEYFKYVA